jgi:transposase InsO family protein
MKQDYPKTGIAMLCGLFGKTRHAYYDHMWRMNDEAMQEDLVLSLVSELRQQLPRLGTRKLHFMLAPKLKEHGITIGRDYFFELLSDHHLLIRQRKRKVLTTNSRHWMRKYSNLVRDLDITRPEQVWVSDITYIRMGSQWGYLSLVTDAYSKKIMGHAFRSDMTAQGCIDALEMALKNRIYYQKLIHHSDRGSQYCSKDYVNILLENNISISMTENGDPYENAIAERVNGIIKSEFNLYSSNLGFDQTNLQINLKIKTYNNVRPHSSCDFLTPDQAHLGEGKLNKRWKNYYKKNNFEILHV